MLFGPWVLGIFICLGNHFSFVALDRKDASRYDPTVVATLKNIWPIAVRACMVASATTAFVPILWSSLSYKSLPVHVLDSTLQLPALAPALKIVFSGSLKTLIIPILVTLNVLSYATITIFPPAALVVLPAEWETVTLRVPTVELTMLPSNISIIDRDKRYVRPRSDFLLGSELQRAIASRGAMDVAPWVSPRGCAQGCTYRVSYRSPGLHCSPYVPDPPSLDSESHVWKFYDARLDLSGNDPVFDMATWPASGSDRYYDRTNRTLSQGTRCTIHEGMHTVEVKFSDETSSVKVTNTSLTGGPFPNMPVRSFDDSCPGFSDNSARSRCIAGVYAQVNTWVLLDAFSSLLTGTVYNSSQSRSSGLEINSTNPLLLPSLAGSIYSNERESIFIPRFHNLDLSRDVENMFAHSTFALFSVKSTSDWMTDVKNASAPPFATQYVYSRRTLWLAYAGALITVMIPGLMGCYFVWQGFVLTDETTLARILVATRDESLDVVKCTSVDSVDDLVLRYGSEQSSDGWKEGMRFSVVSEKGEVRGPIDESERLVSKI